MTDPTDDLLARLDAEVGPLDVDWSALPEVLGVLFAELPDERRPTTPGLVMHPGVPRRGWVTVEHHATPGYALVRLDLASLLPGATAGAAEVRTLDGGWREVALGVIPDDPSELT